MKNKSRRVAYVQKHPEHDLVCCHVHKEVFKKGHLGFCTFDPLETDTHVAVHWSFASKETESQKLGYAIKCSNQFIKLHGSEEV